MVRLFLIGNFSVLFMIPLFIIGYDFFWLNFQQDTFQNDFFLWGSVSLPPITSLIIANIFIYLNAIHLNYIFNVNSFLERNTYLPALIYIIASSFFTFFYVFSIDTIAHFLLILIIGQILRIPFSEERKALLFNTFFVLGLLVTISPEEFVLLVFLIFLLNRFIILKLNDLLIIFCSFLVPFLYAFSFRFLSSFDDLFNENFQIIMNYENEFLKLFLIAIFILTYSFFGFKERLYSAGLQIKNRLQILMAFSLMFVLTSIISSNSLEIDEKISYAYIPLTFLLTFAFIKRTYSLISTSIFYLVTLFSLLKFLI